MTLRRLSALALALIVVASIGLQFWLNGFKPELAPWATRAWDLLRYFTILRRWAAASAPPGTRRRFSAS
jgi:hypothetical protein